MEPLIDKYEIPDLPGVYLMRGKKEVIYIGKAKNLKKRVSSYFKKIHTDKKTMELVDHIEDLEFIVCKSELDALILENNLIKKYLPKYNILLKDQKTYPYIKISIERFPKISIIRRSRDIDVKTGDYFGPYPNGSGFLLKTLVKIFKIRDCKRDMKKTYPKPCLKYYMNRCMGPCAYKDIEVTYKESVENAKYFLKGRGDKLLKQLKEEMNRLSTSMEFEKAIQYREQITAIENSLKTQVTEVLKDIDEDVFVCRQDGDILFLTILKIRDGKIIGVNNLKVDILIEDDILVESFLRYYSNEKMPKNIILDSLFIGKKEILEGWGKSFLDINLKLYFPILKSRRKKLLEMAYLNLEEEIKKYHNQKNVLEEGMKVLYETLNLNRFPRKIECFDISNISGKDAVGAMSVAVEGRLAKKYYRKFKIKTKDTPDDYHMMREVVERRYSKLAQTDLPDLILIDGGLGQLNAVEGVFFRLRKDHLVDIISIAKREEEVFKAGETGSYIFPKNSESLKILQRLRDEAHRFGITYHRNLRKKRVISSELDEIQGIGPKRKKDLLKRFKSVKRIKEATLEELLEVVPERIARQLKKIKNNN
ncbi:MULTISPECIES: excinuclease ABC subunit UvrC [Psychrilyobacter]|uniref:UvrABC system protein C n=1 Tax=Psychrilyobacter piezotolerans TaxID=2293438 RepID=A0ABX9KK87_9FUSO|nr:MULTISPECIES: excinuclease ABC subunit UvrC [Psychrilyobacter]MCS5420526.1 excinuclease ABC subunit UvrC [Psychrilyobacter sp. S5]NDI76910.1 excinuclease ABC subunit UvrC [Psychrilyobacter piezotolerans]RDE65187.1 excinuclease ABC subunit UvrC [Psychrilyobacter sp. S5]REI42757.1 excinuclease ABC subunit UvrC [Psychrilyobacter piezotolerans]